MAWNPTHVQVAVQRAKDLLSKGKSGTNDVFVTIALSKEKYQTSLKAKATDPEWYEECDLQLPSDFNESSVEIVVLHRNGLGIDEFLGRIDLPLSSFDMHEPPKARWYKLQSKPGHKKNKERGELEVRLAFIVSKVKDPDSQSTASSASKHLKSGKKMIKHAASVIGEKLGVKKKDKTSDHIPDIAGVDEGVLNTGDIAENYSLASYGKKTDTLSLPPGSPTAKRAGDSSKKFNLLTLGRDGKKRDTQSVHGSSEDLAQKGDATAVDSLGFKLGHRRAASSIGPQANSVTAIAAASVIDLKPSKNSLGKRGLLSKEKSQSTWEVTTTRDEFGTTALDNAAQLFDRLDPPKPGSNTSTLTDQSRKSGPELVVDDYSDDITAYINDSRKNERVPVINKTDIAKQLSDKGTHSRHGSSSSVSVVVGPAARADDAQSAHGTSPSHGKAKTSEDAAGIDRNNSYHSQQQLPPSKRELSAQRPLATTQTQTADSNDIPPEFRHVAKEVLVDMVVKMRAQLKRKEDHVHDLEEYIDRLLLRVLDGNPNLLQVPVENSAKSTKVGRK